MYRSLDFIFVLGHTFSCCFLSLSLSLFLSIFTMDNRKAVYNITKLPLFLFLFLSPKVPLLLHLMQIYGSFCPCFKGSPKDLERILRKGFEMEKYLMS